MIQELEEVFHLLCQLCHMAMHGAAMIHVSDISPFCLQDENSKSDDLHRSCLLRVAAGTATVRDRVLLYRRSKDHAGALR